MSNDNNGPSAPLDAHESKLVVSANLTIAPEPTFATTQATKDIRTAWTDHRKVSTLLDITDAVSQGKLKSSDGAEKVNSPFYGVCSTTRCRYINRMHEFGTLGTRKQ